MKRSVLLVDDSHAIRVDLQNALAAAGFAVSSSPTLTSAREHLKLGWFSVVVLDVNLPDGNGIDLLDELNRDPRLRRIPVLLLSLESEARTRVRGMLHGAVEYISKPYDRAYLVQRVGELSRHMAGVASAPRWLGDQRVLVIDRSPLPHDALSHHLRCEGHGVVVARSDTEALDFLDVATFACVIVNLGMTVAEGVAVCRRVKESPGGAGVQVLVLASHADPDVRCAASAAGADDVVLATATFGLLRIRLRALLRKASREKQPKPS